MRICVALVGLAACAGSGVSEAPDAATPPDATAPDARARAALEIDFLGVQGFLLRHDGDQVLTAPLYTRPSLIDVSLNTAVTLDDAATDAGLAPYDVAHVQAIVTGHAHYDHLMDVPHIMTALAPDATLFANTSARHLLAALAPTRPAGCTGTPTTPLDPARVIAMDDPAAPRVDYRNCPDQAPPGAPLEGTWVDVPGAHVRILALCGMHPAQFGSIHFGEGSVDQDQCALPAGAGDWKEGHTLSYLIDFLGDDGAPAYRVYYQDAPGDAPIGFPPAAELAEKPVDVALLCTGSYDQVADDPQTLLAALQPRYAISGHWEDFFQPVGVVQPLPFTDMATYDTRVAGAMTPGAIAVRPMPGDHITVAP